MKDIMKEQEAIKDVSIWQIWTQSFDFAKGLFSWMESLMSI